MSTTVTISFTRQGRNVDATISPFVAVIDEKDDIEWKLEGDAVEEVDIAPKKPADWPFTQKPPGNLKKGGKQGSGAVKADAKKRTGYNIEGSCDVEGETVRFVIDPDIIIIRGGI